jgi:hypothetical protein
MKIQFGTKLDNHNRNSEKQYRVSDNNQYAVSAQHKNKDPKLDGSKSVYVKTGHQEPLGSQKGDKRIRIDGDVYEQYTPKEKAYNDCLHHTEEIMNRKRLSYGGGVYSRSALSKQAWGESDVGNLAVSKNVRTNFTPQVGHNANPKVGQGYVTTGMLTDSMLKDGWNTKTGNPFHAAPVVARDNNDTVTLEASAPTADGGTHDPGRSADARYYMQTVGSKRDSFHAQMEDSYTVGNDDRRKRFRPVTHVIEPKDPDSEG